MSVQRTSRATVRSFQRDLMDFPPFSNRTSITPILYAAPNSDVDQDNAEPSGCGSKRKVREWDVGADSQVVADDHDHEEVEWAHYLNPRFFLDFVD